MTMENNFYFETDEQQLKKDLTGTCRACLDENNLKDIFETYYYRGNPEVYAEMLATCFSIQIQNSSEDEPGGHVICEVCVWKLREASQFRTQLELAQNAFKIVIEQKHEKAAKTSEPSQSEYTVSYDEFLNEDSTGYDGDDVQSTDLQPLSTKPSCNDSKPKCKMVSYERKSEIIDKPEHKLLGKDNKLPTNSTKRPPKKKYPSEILPYQLDDNDLECKLCAEVFPYNKNLRMHMSVHYPNYICHKCGKMFSTSKKLVTHRRSVHPYELYPCTLCKVKLKSNSSFKIHMLAHKGIYPERHGCPQCDMKFSTYLKRQHHVVEKHGGEKKKYACKLCSKRYPYSAHLSSHVRNFHLNQRNHVCEICNFGFFDRQSLVRHMSVHTGERKYECTVCDKKYTSRFALREHMRIHNNNVRQNLCTLCGRNFTQKCSLKQHVLKIHGIKSVNPDDPETENSQE